MTTISTTTDVLRIREFYSHSGAQHFLTFRGLNGSVVQHPLFDNSFAVMIDGAYVAY